MQKEIEPSESQFLIITATPLEMQRKGPVLMTCQTLPFTIAIHASDGLIIPCAFLQISV